MPELLKPDLCVIGAGSAGLSVAAIAAAFGVSCVLIEKGEMGGDCLNTGCVPSKAMIAAAKHADAIRKAKAFGVTARDVQVNFGRVHQHVRSVIETIAPIDSEERFTALGVHVIRAAATFTDKTTVVAGDYEIKARRFVVATGSSPAVPPIPGLAEASYLTNETIFENTRRPAHLIIIGGGPIGMELAQAHARLGADVTVIEAATPLSKDDPELTAIVIDAVKADGVTVMDKARVKQVSERSGGVSVVVEMDGIEETLDGSHLLIAAGRTPNTDGLGLDAAGIHHDQLGITVNKNLQTSNRRVYAIGDVAGALQFTHVANYHAGLVIQSALFRVPAKVDPSAIPWVTFTDPELAHVGMTEAQARAKRLDFQVLRWPYAENDRAQAERTTTGFAKVIVDKKGRILGASIVGAQAGELIQMWTLAIAQKLKIGALRGFISPYPTLTEINKRVAVEFYRDMPQKPLVRRLLAFLRRFG